MARGWNRRRRVATVAVTTKRDVRAGDRVCAGAIGGTGARDAVGVCKHQVVGLLNHEQRNVFKGLTVVETVASTEDQAATKVTEARCLCGPSLVRADRGHRGNSARGGCEQFLVGAAIGLGYLAVGVDITIVAKAEIEDEPLCCAPIILQVNADHLGRKIKARVTRGSGRALDRTRAGEACGEERLIAEQVGSRIKEVELRRRIVLEKTAYLRFVKKVSSYSEGVLAKCVRQIVAELELVLAGFLRNIRIGTEANAIREGEVRRADCGIDQVVPVLEAGGEVIHDARS